MSKKKVFLAFFLAPWPLALIYILLFSLFGSLGAGVIAAIVALLISYTNLIIFALPLYYFLNKYNLWQNQYVLTVASSIGFLENVLLSKSEIPDFTAIALGGTFLAINSFIVAFSLLILLNKNTNT